MTEKIVESGEVEFEVVSAPPEQKELSIQEPVSQPVKPPLSNGTPFIELPDLILYDEKGKPFRHYAKVLLSPVSKDANGIYLYKTQEEWTNHCLRLGGEIPSLPLWYAILEKMFAEKNPALEEIKEDIYIGSGLCTSTSFDYFKRTLTHGAGLPSQFTFSTTKPPFRQYIPIRNIEENPKMRLFLQHLLMPKDLDQAIETLEKIGGDKTILSTTYRKPSEVTDVLFFDDFYFNNCFSTKIINHKCDI